jgi:V/A-type H+-transporting ATPase subunit C
MVAILSKMKGPSLYLRVIQMEIDVVNLKTLFRLRSAGISGAQALEYIISGGLHLTADEVASMANAPFDEFIALLSKQPYWSAISDVVTDRMDALSKVELRLDKYLNEYVWRSSTFNPLTVLPMLGYMLSKDTEVENITAIARGKEAGLSEETIKEHLIL